MDGDRRKVLILRGASHFQFLRALEYQCEFRQDKANGSVVVASCVSVGSAEGPRRITPFLQN